MITLTFRLTEKEFFQAARGRYFLRIGIIMFIVFSMFFLANLLDEEPAAIMPTSWLLFLVFVLILWLALFYRSIRKAYRQSASSKGEVTYIFSEDQISTKSVLTESTFKWEAIQVAKENPKFFFLYLSNVTALIVPKRAFESVSQQGNFQHLLITKGKLKP